MEEEIREKAKSFFKYLLELSSLNEKTIRSIKEFEKIWSWDEFDKIKGCYIGDSCIDDTNLLEVHKPNNDNPSLILPQPDKKLKKWIDFDYHNEKSTPAYHDSLNLDNKDIKFNEKPEIVTMYKNWLASWDNWVKNTIEYKQAEKTYSEFFDLINILEKESDSVELVVSRGFIKWSKVDQGINIELPLFSTKVFPKINAEKGIISITDETNELKYETEIFTGIQLPNIQQIKEIVNEIEQLSFKDDLSSHFEQFVNLLDANGKFIHNSENYFGSKGLILLDRSFLVLRSKSTKVLKDDLNQIINFFDDEIFEVPDSLRSILGDHSKNESHNGQSLETTNINSQLKITPNQLYFPLDSNEQQKDIIKRIEQHNGVTVQGPPGTGKTHTIANLVSHFLAEGKKILITTQKDSPLRVLKNKIPEDIRDLCVPVLGGDTNSFNEIEQSIAVINEKLGELDTQKLKKEVKRNQELFHKSKQNEALYRNKLKEYASSEGTPITYKERQLFKYDVAKLLAETNISYDWIIDEVPFEVEFPLNEVEWADFVKLQNSFEKEYESIIASKLPSLDNDILNEDEFKYLLDEEKNLLAEIDETLLLPLEDKPSKEVILQNLRSIVEKIIENRVFIEDKKYKTVIDDLQAGGQRKERWITQVNDIKEVNNNALSLYNILIQHSITLPDKPLNEIQKDVNVAKDCIEKGKKPGILFFLGRGKETKYLFQTPVLNGKSIENTEEIAIIEKHIDYNHVTSKIARIFNGNMTEIGLPGIEISQNRFPHLIDEKLTLLLKIIDTVELTQELNDLLTIEKLQIVNELNVSDYENLLKKIEQTLSYIKVEAWRKKFNNELQKLEHLARIENMNGIAKSFLIAMQEKNLVVWKALSSELSELHRVYSNVTKWRNYVEKLSEVLPLTVQKIIKNFGEIRLEKENYLEVFDLRKLDTWLNSDGDSNVEVLKKQLQDELDLQKKLVQNIVRDATWASQIERITDSEKKALTAWKSFIKRIGKGTGKSAPKYIREARKTMKQAQTAIPVWIMPINQVLQNFPITNEKFDAIIFDESSQCDLFSINILLRGKKVIVVGDDEQISPQSIGTKTEDVDELVRRYIQDIPNGYLYNGEISLYEIAAMNFPKEGQLMLREHFRCVPEIIQFSNDLSYGGRMIPLRLPLESDKIEPPVLSVYVKDGYTDEREKDVNYSEAKKIVEDILEMINNPKYDHQTFGVISLQGQKQHKLLETKIREAIGEQEFIKRKVICGNPYTLQGDERDIIFLSMVVAPNRRFNALTKKQDKQRYNVAASRARNQMRLYHSVTIDELNINDLRYKLLSYCQNPSRAKVVYENLEDRCESVFEKDVLKMILAKGYRVTPQVEVGQYRIDFVIEGLRDRLAVECDGERWHGPEKYEEDMKRQESLERAGWKFWRVRGKNFYFDRINAMESLWKTLSEMGIEH